MSGLNDEIIEEKRKKEPPELGSAYDILLQLQQSVGQMAGQLDEISRKVQRHDEILNSRGATGQSQSRVKDRSFECPDPKYTSLQICLGGEREPALDRSVVFTPLDRIFDQVMGLAFLKGDELRPEMRSFQDLIKLGNDNILQNLIIPSGETEDRRFPSIVSEGGLQFRPPERGSICYIEPEFEEFSSFDHSRHMSENVSIFLNSLQEVSIVNGRLVRGAENSGSILRGHCAYLRAAAHLKAQVVSASSEDSFGLEEHLRKATTARSDEQAARETSRDDSAEPQPRRPEDPVLLASPETTGQAGQLPRRPHVLCDFGSAPKTGRQPMAATAVLLEQNLLREGAVPAPRRSSRIEGLPPQNFKEPDGRKHPGVGGADHVPPGPPAPRGQQTNAVRLVESLERLGDASAGITAAANSQVEKLMGGITKRSGSKSLSDPLMISRFEELKVFRAWGEPPVSFWHL